VSTRGKEHAVYALADHATVASADVKGGVRRDFVGLSYSLIVLTAGSPVCSQQKCLHCRSSCAVITALLPLTVGEALAVHLLRFCCLPT